MDISRGVFFDVTVDQKMRENQLGKSSEGVGVGIVVGVVRDICGRFLLIISCFLRIGPLGAVD